VDDLSYAHSRTHTRTHSHTLAHTRTHSHTLAHTHTHSHTHTHIHMKGDLSYELMHRGVALKMPCMHYACARTHTHTHIHTHTQQEFWQANTRRLTSASLWAANSLWPGPAPPLCPSSRAALTSPWFVCARASACSSGKSLARARARARLSLPHTIPPSPSFNLPLFSSQHAGDRQTERACPLHNQACARSLALKQCLTLPKPLWHEVLELCGNDCREISGIEILKRIDLKPDA